MADASAGSSNMADRGGGALDRRRAVVVSGEYFVDEVTASRSSLEPLLERLLAIEQLLHLGLYSIVVVFEPVASQGSPRLFVAAPISEYIIRERGDTEDGPTDTRDARL